MWRMFSHLSVGTMGATNCSDVQRFLRDAFQGWLAMLAVFFHMLKNRFAAEFGQKSLGCCERGSSAGGRLPQSYHLLPLSQNNKRAASFVLMNFFQEVNPAGLPQFNSPPGGGARIYPRNKGPKGPGRCLVFHHWQKLVPNFCQTLAFIKAWLFIEGIMPTQ